MGTFHMVQNTPVHSSSTRQSTVETATYATEFIAGRTCLDEALSQGSNNPNYRCRIEILLSSFIVHSTPSFTVHRPLASHGSDHPTVAIGLPNNIGCNRDRSLRHSRQSTLQMSDSSHKTAWCHSTDYCATVN
jgi:hypothetical protein